MAARDPEDTDPEESDAEAEVVETAKLPETVEGLRKEISRLNNTIAYYRANAKIKDDEIIQLKADALDLKEERKQAIQRTAQVKEELEFVKGGEDQRIRRYFLTCTAEELRLQLVLRTTKALPANLDELSRLELTERLIKCYHKPPKSERLKARGNGRRIDWKLIASFLPGLVCILALLVRIFPRHVATIRGAWRSAYESLGAPQIRSAHEEPSRAGDSSALHFTVFVGFSMLVAHQFLGRGRAGPEVRPDGVR